MFETLVALFHNPGDTQNAAQLQPANFADTVQGSNKVEQHEAVATRDGIGGLLTSGAPKLIERAHE